MLKPPFYSVMHIFHSNHTVQSLRVATLRSYSSGTSPKSANSFRNVISFDPETIELIRTHLQTRSSKSRLKFTYDTTKIVNEAAVLVPLCIVDREPSVLFTIRSLSLKTHMGEVSFPGGKRDPADQTLVDTALRETYEETGILPTDVDILGQDAILPNKDLTMHVHSFVGFVKHPIDVNEVKYNKNEVSGVFTVALNDLFDPEKRTFRQFRNLNLKYPVFHVPGRAGLEIWGLTAFILDSVLGRLTDLPSEK